MTVKRNFAGVVCGMVVLGLAGCASLGDNEIHVRESQKLGVNASPVRSQATIRISGYADARGFDSPRRLGIANARVGGLSGKDIMLDRDAAVVVADFMRKRLDDAGIQMLSEGDPGALYELGGVIREMRYDVKMRDYVHVKVETVLKEVATGQVLWSGEVEQKSDHFAGMSGASKGDIADNLSKELGVVTGKTAEAVSSVLMATRPDLFNLTAGTKVIPGVKVFVTPGVAEPAPLPAAALTPISGGKGRLVIRTEPGRGKVYLDGVYYGMSPLTIESAAGIRVVEVKLNGYKTASEKVAVRLGETTELELQLEK